MTLASYWRRSRNQLMHRLFGARNTTVPPVTHKKANQWSIAIYTGQNPFAFVPSPHVTTPALTGADVSDVPARFVADPFMLKVDHRWHMFFEVMNASTRKGEIGYAVSDNGMSWSYQQIVLAEPSHMAYPYVFEWMGDFYMMPSIRETKSVQLYRAVNFPYKWSYCKTLLSRSDVADASIAHMDGRWWIFVETSAAGRCDTLSLYYATDLMGPWYEHPKSPIIEGNPHIARPGGRVIAFDGRVIRYAQDCFPQYGQQLRAFEITELTTKSYKEQEAPRNPILSAASGDAWNAAGMHHIDPHQISDNAWIACVDGHRKVWRPDSSKAPRPSVGPNGFSP